MPQSSPLFVQASGPVNVPKIVFLHGGGGGAWMWEPAIALLPDYRCLAPDLPEHGHSRAIGPFSMKLAAEKVAQVIREQAGGKAVVVGLSEGAQVLVQLLADSPELVERAFISSALLRPIPGTGWASSPAMLRWSYRVSIPPFRNTDWWIRLNMKYAAGVPDQYYAQFKKDFQETTESNFVNLMVANQAFRLPPGLEKATAPALIVTGQKEYSAMKQSARDLAAVLPNACLAQVNLGEGASLGSEHNWGLTAPEIFARTLRAWIEGKEFPEQVLRIEKS
jgi:pimeloyl-ACP methyl ester carboxylesterase